MFSLRTCRFGNHHQNHQIAPASSNATTAAIPMVSAFHCMVGIACPPSFSRRTGYRAVPAVGASAGGEPRFADLLEYTPHSRRRRQADGSIRVQEGEPSATAAHVLIVVEIKLDRATVARPPV